ncbi:MULTISPECIES: hypothetical protein [unclassified Corynebacterium]|uniref:hypothetical protein n=1 Tax=unclassified Corynebacterium TaxID=2624378 RepID=UPI0030A354F5
MSNNGNPSTNPWEDPGFVGNDSAASNQAWGNVPNADSPGYQSPVNNGANSRWGTSGSTQAQNAVPPQHSAAGITFGDPTAPASPTVSDSPTSPSTSANAQYPPNNYGAPMPPSEEPEKKGNGLTYALVGSSVLLLGAIGAVGYLLIGGNDQPDSASGMPDPVIAAHNTTSAAPSPHAGEAESSTSAETEASAQTKTVTTTATTDADDVRYADLPSGADNQGWVGTYARCEAEEKLVTLVGTKDGVSAVCETSDGGYYYVSDYNLGADVYEVASYNRNMIDVQNFGEDVGDGDGIVHEWHYYLSPSSLRITKDGAHFHSFAVTKWWQY